MRAQQGFSLTELLVALVISTILLLAASTLLVAGKESWRSQQRLNSAQEIERYTVLQLRRAIRQAQQVNLDSDEQQANLTYLAQDGSRNCLGQEQTAGTEFIDQFRVNDDQLRCNGQALIAGVASLTFAYGADLNGDGRILEDEHLPEPHCCIPVRSLRFRLAFSGINADRAPVEYSAALRRN
ncbi:PilW family protein [Nitrincola sp.]|uniref:PilW family protein n=1 Tax=Nitrincola sp. TaxID=1926584 RepID=UPI003A92BCC0